MNVSLLSSAQPGDPWYWRWGRPVLFVAAGFLVVVLAGRGLTTLVEINETVTALATIQSVPVLWKDFLAGLTTGPVVDRVAVAAAGGVVVVGQLGKLVSIAGLGLLVWELAYFLGEKVGAVQRVQQDADANSES